ncbi:3-hydroxyisobutyryl-CoA hydrolase, mitochondrial isoform X2 [Cephus cinctus]|uniref:3-hydroxyisobutyryl-CoA hydrolase, mitochondrial n=1 Tax=Cephus cinctus TaxID=211228 RepID=A0AAJ7FGB9_CEPCN|nr:3-hydroxyisobutyryl-CoA hydrolase, mitochondrial isoform X2 [Cephus cinctus]
MIRSITSKLKPAGLTTRAIRKSTIMLSVHSSSAPTKGNNKDAKSEAEDDVLFEDVADKGVFVLNRPKALNALNLSMVRKIYRVLKEWETSKKLVVVKGASGKAFCAGGDVKSLVLALNEPGGEAIGQEFFRAEYTMDHLIGTYKIPYVALIHGITMGGGVGISIHGKYRVATENTLFAMPETAIGLVPDVGASYFLPRLKGKLGLFLGLTGQRIKGVDVLLAGIATHYVPSERIEDLTKALLTTGNIDIDSTIKKFQPENLNQEFSLAPYLSKIDNYFSAPTVEEIVNRLEADGSDWAKDVLQLLNNMSPTALKMAKISYDKGSQLSLAECLKMEYRLMCSTLTKTSDFYEGVRALLIDKDKNPKWNPKTLQEVTDESIKQRLELLPTSKELQL